ncbi:MAG: type I-U CRISPR-associated protein Cas7 [Phycisphaerae bacterium]|nr:MAG: type I-U CRISPR-associated protein Cas7 [Phycisphaerae bacterium]
MSDPSQYYDEWLTNDSFAAIVIREPLVSVEGPDGVIFPATYAASKDGKFPGGYNIDPPEGEKNVCIVDSVGSQANRIEPIFANPTYSDLVPQIIIEAGEKKVNLLEAGHRAGDAIVRSTLLHKELQDAFKRILNGNALPMAKIAPTSLVFGVWDSRDTQAKLPRLIVSTIRAFDVQKLTRSAVYIPPVNYVNLGLITEEQQQKATGDEKNPLSQRGFVNALASATHGGVIARGGVRRDVTFSLAALRLLSAGNDEQNEQKTLKLRRYILGLSLIAITAPPQTYLRQGCNLVLDLDKPRSCLLVKANGTKSELQLTHEKAIAYAKIVANDFGVGESKTVKFDPDLANKDISGVGNVTPTKKTRAQARATATQTDGQNP